MGYQMDYCGELEPTRPISAELKARFDAGSETTLGDLGKVFENQDLGLCRWQITNWGNLEVESGSTMSYGEYEVMQWLKYFIANVFTDNPLNGTIEWQGEHWDERGAFQVVDNKITTGHYELVFDEEEAK